MHRKRYLTIILLMGFAVLTIAGSAVADWQQVNTDGFGDPNNFAAGGLVTYGTSPNRYIYTGVDNSATGAEIWRSSDGQNWTPVVSNQLGNGGFGVGASLDGVGLINFNDQMICAETQGSAAGDARVYCSSTGDPDPPAPAPPSWIEITWDSVNLQPLGPRNTSAIGIASKAVFNDAFGNPRLIVAVQDNVGQPDIWIYDGANWQSSGFAAAAGSVASAEMNKMVVYQNRLFFVYAPPPLGFTPMQMWQADVNMNWSQVTVGAGMTYMRGMVVFNNTLYVATIGNPVTMWGSNDPLGGAAAWTQLDSNVYTSAAAAWMDPSKIVVLNNELYMPITEVDSADNAMTASVWRSSDLGYNWNRISQFGFGDIGNVEGSGLRVSDITGIDTLFAGTLNTATGGEVWSYDQCDNNSDVRVNPIFAANGITVNIPVTVNLANPIDTFSFDLVYDSNILSYQGIDFGAGLISTTAGWGVNTTASNPTPGTLRVADFRSGGVSIPAGNNQVLIELQFDAAAGANTGDVATFRLQNLNGGLSGLSSTDRCTSAVRDQHDGNVDNVTAGTVGIVTPGDATEAFNFFLQNATVNIPFDDAAQDRADVVLPQDPGSDVTPGDAFQINCYAANTAGTPDEQQISSFVCP